jgi:hypothetical protein
MALSDTLFHFVTLVRKKRRDVKEKEGKNRMRRKKNQRGNHVRAGLAGCMSGPEKIDNGDDVDHDEEDIHGEPCVGVVLIVQFRNERDGLDGTDKTAKEHEWHKTQIRDKKFR